MPSLREAHLRHAAYYWTVLKIAGDLYKDGGLNSVHALKIFDSEWNNITTGQSWAETRTQEDEGAALHCCYYPDAGMYLLDLRQQPGERIHWLEAALAAARIVDDRQAEMRHLGNLGRAYFSIGNLRGSVHFIEDSLVVAEEIGD
jgi:hypothetical protein